MTTASDSICYATIAGNTARHAEPEYPWAAQALFALSDVNRHIREGDFTPDEREQVSYHDTCGVLVQARLWHVGYTCVEALGRTHYYVGECGELVVWCIDDTRNRLGQQLNLAKPHLDTLVEHPERSPYPLRELESLAMGFTHAIHSSRSAQA